MTRDPWTMWSDAGPDDEAAAAVLRPRSADPVCPPPALLQASRSGTLPTPVQERVARHVERCVVCQALGEALDDPSVGEITPDERDRIRARIRIGLGEPALRFGRGRWWLPMAAAVALVATGSVLVWQSGEIPPPIARDVRQADAPSVFQLEKPAIPVRAGTDLVWRGSPDSVEAGDLARALEPYRTNDFGEAARRLSAFVSRHPQSASGHFYLGVSELFRAADAGAVTALENSERLAKDDADLARETAWYLALAYRRTGQRDRAAGQLDALCQGGTVRAGQACAGLSELSRQSSAPGSR